MYILVMIAYLANETPVIKASEDLYNSHAECEAQALNTLSTIADELPPKVMRNIRFVYVCTTVPEDT